MNAHWRDTARSAKFFIIDAKAAFPFLLFLLHITLWTFIFACVATLFFTLLARWGFTVSVFWRWLRCLITGPRKIVSPKWRQ